MMVGEVNAMKGHRGDIGGKKQYIFRENNLPNLNKIILYIDCITYNYYE